MAESPRRSQDSEEVGSRRSKEKFYEFLEDHFFGILIGIACIGMVLAFTVPLWVCSFSKEDSVSALRQAILASTGGTLAIFTLLETHQKNIREKEKNEQDHIRQVHAERRSRYAKAVEQLADEKAPIRLGGVYTLIKLVDEWLADEKTLPNEEERREECQVIINSLCAYIRSTFDLASKTEALSQNETPGNYEGGTQQFTKDQARFREEKELRLTILDAVKARINVSAITQEDKTKKLLKGSWSDFNYEFSNTHFFYPVNFTNSYFGASSNFSGATFTGYADFSGATFAYRADFSRATFTGYANSIGYADFSGASFTGYANFSKATFTEGADFSGASFTGYANFSRATFTEGADFSGAKFTQNANFSGATFTGLADFSGAAFQTEPIFESILDNEAGFSCKVHPESYNFEVSYDSPYKIETEEKEYNGTKFTIPKGAILFDPDGSSEQKDDNDS